MGDKIVNFRHDVNGLRALAVLGVLAFHADFSLFSGGFSGVDVFFVISGYLITGMLVNELRSTGGIDFLSFYSRRFRRLAPAMSLVLVFVVIIATHFYSLVEGSLVAADAFFSWLYLSNIHFGLQAVDYLSGERDVSPLLHYWSLGVEEQFYLFWPVFLLLCLRNYKKQFLEEVGSSYVPTTLKANKHIFICVTLVSSFSFLVNIYLTYSNQPLAFFFPFGRVWEFGVGAIVFLVGSKERGRGSSNFLGLLGITLIVLSYVFLDSQSLYPGFFVVVPVLGAALVILSECSYSAGETLVSQCSRFKLVSFIGVSSYSLYLWHWPFIVFGEYLFGSQGYVKLYSVMLSVPVAVLAYLYIEKPIHEKRLSSGAGWKVGGFCTFFVVLSFLIWNDKCQNCFFEGRQQVNSLGEKNLNLAKDVPVVYRDGCHLQVREVNQRVCQYNNIQSPKAELVLFGDSHAAQWFSPLLQIAKINSWEFSSYTKSACSPADVDLWSTTLNRAYRECSEWREAVIEKLLQASSVKRYIVISSSTKLPALEKQENLDGFWVDGWAQTIRKIEGVGFNEVVFLKDTPRPGYNMSVCLSKNSDYPERCDFYREKQNRIYEQLDDAVPELALLDLSDAICIGSNGVCKSVVSGIPTFRDSHHLSNSFAESLSEVFFERLSEALSLKEYSDN